MNINPGSFHSNRIFLLFYSSPLITVTIYTRNKIMFQYFLSRYVILMGFKTLLSSFNYCQPEQRCFAFICHHYSPQLTLMFAAARIVANFYGNSNNCFHAHPLHFLLFFFLLITANARNYYSFRIIAFVDRVRV